ncbi:hypothetical protein BKI52_07960 [marine bacterium AO1-C]|nr:hypothetical protein BKI52_07960 [marine bacterium AO1-C]
MNEAHQTLGERVVYFRKAKGFSQEQLAEESKISLRTIQRIEKNTSQPRGYTLNAIAAALECKLADLQTPSTPKNSSNTTTEQDLRKLNRINLASFAMLVIPFGNLIVPAILYARLKTDYPFKKTARKVINFQLIWYACISPVFLILPYINQVLSNLVNFDIPLILISIAAAIAYNLYNIIQNSMKINQGNTDIYPRTPTIF